MFRESIFFLEFKKPMEDLSGYQEPRVEIYPYESMKYTIIKNAGGGDCMFYVLANTFAIEDKNKDNAVLFFRRMMKQALEFVEQQHLNELGNTEDPETVYSTLLRMLEPEDLAKLNKNKTPYEQWQNYVNFEIPTSGAWGNQLLWSAWIRNPKNPYIDGNLFTLNCLMIDQLTKTNNRNYSRIICIPSVLQSNLPRFWFIVLRTKVNRKGNEGWGADHFVNLSLNGVKSELEHFPLVYTTKQINENLRGLLNYVGATSCLELLPK